MFIIDILAPNVETFHLKKLKWSKFKIGFSYFAKVSTKYKFKTYAEVERTKEDIYLFFAELVK